MARCFFFFFVDGRENVKLFLDETGEKYIYIYIYG